MWPEYISGRGANEISSCVLKFIKEKSEQGKNIIFLLSDNCPGQNRNRFMATMMWYALKTFRLEKTEHVFLEKGHTQNENDSVHSKITIAAKNTIVYTPDQWYTTVRMARRFPNPYKVTEMSHENMFDFKKMAGKNLRNFEMDDTGNKVMWTKIRSISIIKDDPNALFVKYKHGEMPVRCDLLRKKRRTSEIPEMPNKPPQLNTVRGITEVKKIDLLKLCKEKDPPIIPTIYHEFYETIPIGSHNGIDNEEDD